MELAPKSVHSLPDSYYINSMQKGLKQIFFLCFFLPGILFAQKFHFQNYNVQQGLIQSQISAITQDAFDNLWFCTLGGISRFDGKSFTNYSETDGLISNYANSILADHASNIWIGTTYGISKFNGSVFKSIRMSDSMKDNVVNAMQEDSSRHIFVLSGNRIYRMEAGDSPLLNTVTETDEWVSFIKTDKQGVLWAAVRGRGIYRLENGKWQLKISWPPGTETGEQNRFVFDRRNENRIYILTENQILTEENGVVSSLVPSGKMGRITCFFQDASNRFWLACGTGLYQYADSAFTVFNSANGYEGSHTSAIFEDHESNLWFGTNGTGAFRYSFQSFLIYDQFNAARGTNIMPMIENQNSIYFGAEGAGLFTYNSKNIHPVKMTPDDPGFLFINGLYSAGSKGIYVQTKNGLYLRKPDGKVNRIPLGEINKCVMSVVPDNTGGFWVASCRNLSYVSPDAKTTPVLNLYTSHILGLPGDSVLAGTEDGLYIISKNFIVRKTDNPLMKKTGFMAFALLGKYYLLATSNKGFIIYEPGNGQCRQFTTRNGLNSDFIYSVVTDHKNQIWLGTGRGINRLQMDTVTGSVQIFNLSIPGDISSAESNQGAAIFDNEHNLWFGTVAGLFKFFPDSGGKSNYLPPVVLQTVQVNSRAISPGHYTTLENNWYGIPRDLTLAHNENHLTFSFRCPSFLHSESILYQYQLEGMEKNFSALTPNHFVVYPSLPPGHYTFRARAWLEAAGYSKENIAYSFTIKAAFYQTLYFRFLMLVLLMGIILWIQWFRMRIRMHRLHHIEEVKREENIKVRQTASEDFHDEVGNSLTRIQILTDVLQTKLGAGHNEEKRIINQIKENVSGLYQGTRDILWALNPESDLIKEIGHRLESLGVDVFQDTGICFQFENELEDSGNLKLPGNYNRNIMMIFKEAMSNCMKHARAKKVRLKIQKTEAGEVMISLQDNGIGFDHLFIKKGHGFQNMKKRAGRINSLFTITSVPGQGSRYELRIPLSLT